jgi:hypothetical protein
LRGGWRPSNDVFVLCGLCLDVHVIGRVRHNFGDLHDGRLHCGQCVCRRVGTACRVHMQHRLRINIDHDNCMRGKQWHLPCDRLRRGKRVHG